MKKSLIPQRQCWLRLSVAALLVFGLSFAYRQLHPVAAARIPAATFTVSNANDSGDGSLRKAIEDANAAAGNDTITFSPTVFNMPRTITLTSGQLVVVGSLTINGPGANLLTISGNNASRVFNIGSGHTVNLSGMTMTNGNGVGLGGTGGGCIYSDGNLTVTNSTISNNSTGANGGGILSQSKLTLTNVQVTGNQASAGGGGVYLQDADGVFTGSTFNANTAGGGGGILYQEDDEHTLRLVNSTVSGNTAGSGGGIQHFCHSGFSRIEIVNSTITGNTAGSGIGGIFVRVDEGQATTTLRNTIVASNTPTNLAAQSIIGSATIASQGFNLSDNYNGVFTPLATDLTSATPRLGPLSLNGGTTPTHALLGGSPALNAGDASGSTTDQRGQPRVFGTSADIGAVEMRSLLVTNTTDSLGAGTLRQAITDANVNADLNDIIFGIPPFNTAQTINLMSPLPNITSSVTINGPGANLLTVRRPPDSEGNFRIFFIANGITNGVALSSMTISNGRVGGFGGGIFSQSNLTLTNLHVTGNQASGSGGGVYLVFADGVFTGCTFSGNDASMSGGGIAYQGEGGHTLRLINSTVSGNSADINGGGISNFSSNGASKLEVVSGTIANNTAPTGGGILTITDNANGTATTTLRNTIIAGSTPNNLAVIQQGGVGVATITSLGFNLTGDNSLQFINQSTDFVNTNPLLGPLQNNGGTTPTHALRFGSRALDAGHSSGAMTDQRGLPRRLDIPTINNEPGSDGADIGAYEAQAAPVQPPPPTLAINDVSRNEGNSGTTAFDFTVTLSEASGQTVTVDYISGGGTATAGSDYAPVEGRLTFTPGQTSRTITVLVNGDTTVEPDETFFVNLRSPANATIADAQGMATIINDDTPSLIVQNTNDSGANSLRQVIADAPAGSTVTFLPTMFNVARTITLASEIQITKNLTINGTGANLLTISGNNATRVLRVLGSNLNVTLNDLTITGGRATGSIGGGILSNSALTMNRCVIANNFATTSGGGVHLQAGASGVFTACTFNGNTSASGGALYVEGTGNNLILALTNCTISGNTGTATGGALLHAAASGNSLTAITHCTIANNESADGGGIFIRATASGATPRATTRNSIYANNTNTNLRVLSENGGTATITSLGYNLTTGAGSGLLTAIGDQLNADPLLGPLANNGGTTPTRALLAGSPAHDKGQSTGSASDQRSNRRPFDDPALQNAMFGDGADIGAFEQGQQLFPVSAANYTTPLAQESIAAAFGVNLSNGIGVAGMIPLPTTLNEASFTVRDSLGTERAAPLFFAAPGQVNFQIPPGTALGQATLIARRNGTPTAGATMAINAVEPGLFTANASGAGLPAAQAFRLKANGEQLFEPVATFNAAMQRFDPVPINLAPAGDRVFLILYGTGIRFHGGLNNVKVNVAGLTLDALFAGDPGGFVGLDQINSAELPRSLIGRKEVEVSVAVAGKTTNKVFVIIQ